MVGADWGVGAAVDLRIIVAVAGLFPTAKEKGT
jgi:hypothetical protein